ncbi:TPA: helix-turn-helix domain-containing protein [Yersinia enterocolitica]
MSVISVAILVTQGFSTYHVSVPLILFGDTLTDQRLFTRLICAEKPGLIWSDEGTAIQADHGLDVLTQVDTVIVPFWGDVRKRPSEPLLNALVKAREAGAQITAARLHRSQELLENMDLPVEQVAEQAGFQSAPTFRLQFREKFGVSPREWRKTFRNA